MPIQVDVSRRRADIAAATVQVAADKGGLAGVTIRAVAAELDASTTVVTNYLPTRTDLLVNAIDWLADEWRAELEEIQQRTSGRAAIEEVMEAAVDWDAEELIRCQFWVAALSADRNAELAAHLSESARSVRTILAKLLDEAGHPQPHEAADVLFLFAQGVFVSIVEAPDRWPGERTKVAARAAVAAVMGS